MGSCIFCQIVAGTIPAVKVFENDTVLAFLDINPVNHGHTLVIPKEHYATLPELPEELAARLAVSLQRVAGAVFAATMADGMNVNMNINEAAGQLVPHVHWHLIPRFRGDGLSLWPGRPYPEGDAMADMGEKIRKNITGA